MATVLIVDDESSVLFLLREALEEQGHQVLTATSGARARAMADAGELDDVELVLTDYAMPGLDGMQLLQHLHEIFPTLPVVLLTVVTWYTSPSVFTLAWRMISPRALNGICVGWT